MITNAIYTVTVRVENLDAACRRVTITNGDEHCADLKGAAVSRDTVATALHNLTEHIAGLIEDAMNEEKP